MATMLDVARRANVSLSTVSYAINGTRPISAETRRRVHQAMEELDYRPNALARGLASRRSRIVALLFPAGDRGLGGTELEFVTAAADAARENGYHLVLWSTDLNSRSEVEQLTRQGLVDGVLVMEVRLDDVRVDLLREAGVPFTMIGRTRDPEELTWADIDFEQTTRDAVRHLVELGHHRIAFVNHSEAALRAGYGPAVRAAAGFEAAMAASGLAPIVRNCPDSPAGGRELFAELIRDRPDLTAAVTMNEHATVGMMAAAADAGWTVPADFSLVSIVSSARVAELTLPPLTTMSPPSAELGRLGVEVLIQQLEGHPGASMRELAPCTLVVRGSSGPNLRTGTPGVAGAGSRA